jgi:hypothetical protein
MKSAERILYGAIHIVRSKKKLKKKKMSRKMLVNDILTLHSRIQKKIGIPHWKNRFLPKQI